MLKRAITDLRGIFEEISHIITVTQTIFPVSYIGYPFFPLFRALVPNGGAVEKYSPNMEVKQTRLGTSG